MNDHDYTHLIEKLVNDDQFIVALARGLMGNATAMTLLNRALADNRRMSEIVESLDTAILAAPDDTTSFGFTVRPADAPIGPGTADVYVRNALGEWTEVRDYGSMPTNVRTAIQAHLSQPNVVGRTHYVSLLVPGAPAATPVKKTVKKTAKKAQARKVK